MIIPEFGYGGAEKSFCALTMELNKTYSVKIVVFNLKQPAVYMIGGEVFSLEVDSSKYLFGKLINFFKRVSRLRRIKKQLNPSACISFLEGADYINILSSGEEKTIISVRGSKLFDQNISSFTGLVRKRLLIPILYGKADRIVTLSEGVKEELLANYSHFSKSKINTIYNYINREKIRTLANKPLSKSWTSYFKENRVIIFSGRIAIEKGVQLFLPVFAELIIQLHDIRLVLIGDGVYQTELQNICDKLTLSYENIDELKSPNKNINVYFLGYQPNPFKWVNQASLFVSSSLHEGFGNSILEALTLGVPVIASDCPYGPREIIANKTYKDNIDYPYQVNNGILLPTIDHVNDASNLWVHTILHKLSSARETVYMNDGTSINPDRFSKGEFTRKWINVIEDNFIKVS